MSTWSSFWGGLGSVAGTLWVYMNRDVPYIEAVGRIIETRYSRIDAVLRKIEGAFDLDTATGEALDIWGARLGLLRAGLVDDVYRRALKVRRSLLLSSTGTVANLIAIFEAWTGYSVVEYANFDGAILIAGQCDDVDESRLARFLATAKPGGRQIRVYDVVDGDIIVDYGLDAVTGTPGTVDCGANPDANADPLAGPIVA